METAALMDWVRSAPEQLLSKHLVAASTKSWSRHKQVVSLILHEPGSVEVKQGRAQSGMSEREMNYPIQAESPSGKKDGPAYPLCLVSRSAAEVVAKVAERATRMAEKRMVFKE